MKKIYSYFTMSPKEAIELLSNLSKKQLNKLTLKCEDENFHLGAYLFNSLERSYNVDENVMIKFQLCFKYMEEDGFASDRYKEVRKEIESLLRG